MMLRLDRFAAGVDDATGRVVLSTGSSRHALHPLWIRERSTEPGAVDPTNRQRLYEPDDLPVDLAATSATVRNDTLCVTFSDGYQCSIPVGDIEIALGIAPDPEELPEATPWHAAATAVPLIAWPDLDPADPARAAHAALDALDAFFRLGFFVLTGTPTVPGTLHEIAARFGRLSPTNFGPIFDVVSIPDPSDLAYTPVALSAHLDQPYRRPTPGIQFLHTLVNDAPGGESTVTDGLAAIEALRVSDPEAFDVLCTLPVEYRYDIGTDVVVGHAPMIELHPDGRLRQFRFSPRLDFAPPADPGVLDVYYRGRRWLAEYLNDRMNCLQFRMNAGDVLVVDNHRVLHGRTAYDPTVGHRHLQGCYIDHDGPATMWKLAIRRQSA